MSGYTPVFSTVFEGSLCGRYPDTAAWMFFLALADYKGEVDKTPEYIATVTGMPLADLMGCIERFMQPDPRSRSQAEEGRKLVLIDAARTWGWRVVNIQSYRDKASGRQQVIDGRNAEKVKRYKERHRKTPADTKGHRRTPTHTHTADSDSNTDLEEELPRARALKGGRGNSEEPESPEARKERIQEAIAKFKQYRDAPSTLAMLTKTTVEEVKIELEAFIGAQGRSTLFADLAQRKKV